MEGNRVRFQFMQNCFETDISYFYQTITVVDVSKMFSKIHFKGIIIRECNFSISYFFIAYFKYAFCYTFKRIPRISTVCLIITFLCEVYIVFNPSNFDGIIMTCMLITILFTRKNAYWICDSEVPWA